VGTERLRGLIINDVTGTCPMTTIRVMTTIAAEAVLSHVARSNGGSERCGRATSPAR